MRAARKSMLWLTNLVGHAPIAPVENLTREERRQAYACLLRGFEGVPEVPQQLESRWTWLMAAHVVGQHVVDLHFDSHVRMLRLARQANDWREAAGQVLRIALLPLGHLLGRIPLGNIGRSTVPVTRPMDPPEPVQVLIDWAVLSTRIAGSRW